MSTARSKVMASLAERGRPEPWANEAEAAALSGMSFDTFKEKLPGLEARGFPRKNLDNGKRPIPGILAFWKLAENDGPQHEPENRELERWTQ